MVTWKGLGAVVSDPLEGYDTELWQRLLMMAADECPQLYVKLIGLRYAGLELIPDEKTSYRLQLANHAVVKDDDVKALLTPHSKILLYYMRCL